MTKIDSIKFCYAKSSQKALLYQWFQQPHIQEWLHGIGLQNTLDGLEEFFAGEGKPSQDQKRGVGKNYPP